MSTRPGRVLGIVVGCLVAIAAVAAIVASLRAPATWDAASPERAVQSYLSAVIDGDAAKAAWYLDPTGECGVSDLDRAYVAETQRVDLVSSHTDGDTARVEVAFAVSTGGPLDGAVTERHTFRLTRPAGRWVIAGMPWPLYECRGGIK